MPNRNPNSLEVIQLITRMLKQAYPTVRRNEYGDGPGNESSVTVSITNGDGKPTTYAIRVWEL